MYECILYCLWVIQVIIIKYIYVSILRIGNMYVYIYKTSVEVPECI